MDDTENISEVTLLRTLTRKSQMRFGKFFDSRVQDLLNLGFRERSYLAWCYYNCSKISFSEDVLDELGINEEIRIEKPSEDNRIFYAWKDKNLSDNQRMGLNTLKNSHKKRCRMKNSRSDGKRFSKSEMQNRNHGRK